VLDVQPVLGNCKVQPAVLDVQPVLGNCKVQPAVLDVQPVLGNCKRPFGRNLPCLPLTVGLLFSLQGLEYSWNWQAAAPYC
jgi:hypothetical protein